MGFNKKYLPKLEEFQERLKNNPSIIDGFENADAWIGDPRTADLINQLLEEKYRKKDENTVVSEGEHAHRSDGVLPTLL